MIGSQYRDPKYQNRGFVKHVHHVLVDMGVYPDNPTQRLVEMYQIVLMENLQSTGSGGGKPRDTLLFRKVLAPNADPTSGVWDELRVWHGDGTGDYDDANSSGSVSVDEKTGAVHVMLVFGKLVGGVVRFLEWEETIKRSTFGPTIVRPPAATGGTDQSAAVAALQRASAAQAQTIAAIELALANIKQEPGALDLKDRNVLNRMRGFFDLD